MAQIVCVPLYPCAPYTPVCRFFQAQTAALIFSAHPSQEKAWPGLAIYDLRFAIYDLEVPALAREYGEAGAGAES